MPQLDKVTLFSQVFWLLFLYFFFFLIYLKYFLPVFSKLFKVRSHYLTNWGSANVSSTNKSVESSHLSTLLSKFDAQLKANLTLLQNYYSSELNFYNFNLFKEINRLFILIYIKNCLKFNLYKNYIFK